MHLEAVDVVIKDPILMNMFNIPDNLWPAIQTSWAEKQPDFQGRFDFHWGLNTSHVPQLLEFNADTPSLQLESGILSKRWLEQKYFNNYNQANYLDRAFNYSMNNIVKTCGLTT